MEGKPPNESKCQISDVPKRILIVRLSAIGDVILGVPVLCALRKAFPEAEIGWIVQGPGAQILKGHPDLNTLITIPKLSFEHLLSFWKQLPKRDRSAQISQSTCKVL